MIQKGIIELVISAYEYKVRIPRYDKLATTPGGVSNDELSSAIVCSVPGSKVSFIEGDIVLVGFENNELNKPVILGLLYREGVSNTNQFILPNTTNALSKLETQINAINDSNLYVHIKYSNDNGRTFTSLYEYTDVSTIATSQNIYKGASNITIDPDSSVIYWSVIDTNNVDITSSLNITTTLSSSDTSVTESFTDTLIRIPIKFKGLSNLQISFRILQTLDYDDYYIVLTTDKNTLGSVYGDYMGICVSTDPIPPLIPSAYSWTSFYDSIEYLVSKLENALLPRVERNEKALYGYTYSDAIQDTDGTGLLDGIRVEKNIVHIYGAEGKNIQFNANGSMLIDNEHDNFTTKDLEYTNISAETIFSELYNEKGHLVLSRRKRV